MGIAGTVGGLSLAFIVILAVLAKEHLTIAPWIVGALAFMGLGLGLAASKKP